MPPRPAPDRHLAPLMLVFSEPHRRREEAGSGRRASHGPTTEQRPGRAATRRQIEDSFKARVTALAETIDLASARDLSAHPHVAASILNHGRPDVTAMVAGASRLDDLAACLHKALESHEPAIVAGSLSVREAEGDAFRHGFNEVSQSLRYVISLDLTFSPLPIPVTFHADLDVAAGKLQIDAASPSAA